MKRIVSILTTLVMILSCMVVFGICADAASEPKVTKVNNYTVTIDGITDVKEIRYAIGHYTKGDQVRNAEKNQTLSASLVNAYTENGVMTYEVPWVGEYTFWVRLNDGSQHFIYADVTKINPYVESDGLRLTVKDFGENYKDMWIAEGTWNSYAEIKNNATTKYQAAAAKLSNYFANHDFTYVTANPGEHTVLIRYNDGTQDVIHTELTVDVPTFEVNGLQVTIGNIPGVKIIRTAYGEHNSAAEIKKAEGVRNFNNKTAIKDAEAYRVQYRDNGVVTIIVEYTTGYKHVEHITIEQKTATVENTAAGLKFGNLDGLVMIRYAKGEYTSSNAIKNAPGSVALKSDAMVDGHITVSGLTVGEIYSFCVQYDDESYDYHVIKYEAVASADYTVTFTDHDGKVLATEGVAEGGTAKLPEDPSKSGAEFLGWSGNYANVSKDETVVAVYSDISNVLLVESATGGIGDTVTLLVSIDGKVSTCGFDFILFYDSALELISYDEDLDLDIVANPSKYVNGIKLNFSASTNRTRQRDIIELNFKIKSTNKRSLPVFLEMTDIFEVMDNGTIITAPYTVINGIVNVK